MVAYPERWLIPVNDKRNGAERSAVYKKGSYRKLRGYQLLMEPAINSPISLLKREGFSSLPPSEMTARSKSKSV